MPSSDYLAICTCPESYLTDVKKVHGRSPSINMYLIISLLAKHLTMIEIKSFKCSSFDNMNRITYLGLPVHHLFRLGHSVLDFLHFHLFLLSLDFLDCHLFLVFQDCHLFLLFLEFLEYLDFLEYHLFLEDHGEEMQVDVQRIDTIGLV